MTPGQLTVAVWLLLLTAASALYAVWLNSLHGSYEPDWTWATVVAGNALIGGTLLGIELCGVTLTFWIVLLANIAAGAPILIWQGIKIAHRRGRNGHTKP